MSETIDAPAFDVKTPAGLKAALEDLRARNEMIRARDAAEKLGVSEGELVACRVGDNVTRLREDFGQIIQSLPALGTVMILTRNDHVVHEKVGEFDHVSVQPSSALVLNHDIDLRIFLNHWHFGFAVSEEGRSGLRHSLQFFSLDGTAIHKIYTREDSTPGAYEKLVEKFQHEDQTPGIEVGASIPKKTDRPDEEIDLDGLRSHWSNLQDTHDFFGMLHDFNVGRQQALRLAGDEFASEVTKDAMREMMTRAAKDETPIMCFVGNPGCIQIHTGPVQELKDMGPWFNVLDPKFNLHLREDRIARAFIVRKPTRDGVVTSLEVYDDNGFCFVQFFGERKPGKPELESWRDLAESLPRLGTREAA